MTTSVEFSAAQITARDGTGTRYLTNVAFEGLPFSWRPEDALLIRKQGLADELLPKLRKAFPTLRFTQAMIKRRELR